LASFSTSCSRKPLTLDGQAVDPVRQESASLRWPVGVSLSRRGLRSAPRASAPARCGADGSIALRSMVSTAATIGVVPAAPRPRLPPG
jgi:hypothetical protein